MRPPRQRIAGIAALAVAATLSALSAHPSGAEPTTTSAGDGDISVVVTGPDATAAARQVRLAGGVVTAKLPLVDGVAAQLPVGAKLPTAYSVVPDRAVSFASEAPSGDSDAAPVREALGLAPKGDEGAGVTVALVDTGVADVEDLSGRLDHIDVTGTGPGDGYGHGTYLAGVIAGSGATSGGRYQGVAPEARILDVKVADGAGVTSLGLVLQGLQEVSDSMQRYGTKVVNLSLASGSPMPYQVDPLNQALRRLWHRGLTVVVAAGNDGPEPGSIASPGNDPTVLTAGALDDGSTAAREDDGVAGFSGRGPTNQGVQKPDLVAPGVRVAGLRAPGSYVDLNYPQARLGDDHVRGSGTSAAAAVTSAAIADILAGNPDLTPDELKYLVTKTAYSQKAVNAAAGGGAGGLDLRAALKLADSPQVARHAAQRAAAPGTVEEWKPLAEAFARGDRSGAEAAWRQLSPAARSWAARSWSTLDPVARSWSARSWSARSWADSEVSSREWAARAWAARSWSGEDWAARSWSGQDWSARSWSGDDWAARSWSGDDWAARSWSSDLWSARSWSAAWQ